MHNISVLVAFSTAFIVPMMVVTLRKPLVGTAGTIRIRTLPAGQRRSQTQPTH